MHINVLSFAKLRLYINQYNSKSHGLMYLRQLMSHKDYI